MAKEVVIGRLHVSLVRIPNLHDDEYENEFADEFDSLMYT